MKKNLAIVGYGGQGAWHANWALKSDVISLSGIVSANCLRSAGDNLDNAIGINYTMSNKKATDRRLVLKNSDYKEVTAILSGPAVTFLCDL